MGEPALERTPGDDTRGSGPEAQGGERPRPVHTNVKRGGGPVRCEPPVQLVAYREEHRYTQGEAIEPKTGAPVGQGPSYQ